MKKLLFTILSLFSFAILSAQSSIVLGDMNNDEKITISDVTEVVNTMLGKTPVKKIAISESASATISEESLIGKWRKISGEYFTIKEDGKASISNNVYATSYEYYPNQGRVVFLDSQDNIVSVYDIIRQKENYLAVAEYGSSEIEKYYYVTEPEVIYGYYSFKATKASEVKDIPDSEFIKITDETTHIIPTSDMNGHVCVVLTSKSTKPTIICNDKDNLSDWSDSMTKDPTETTGYTRIIGDTTYNLYRTYALSNPTLFGEIKIIL